jgi:hypothetical protein
MSIEKLLKTNVKCRKCVHSNITGKYLTCDKVKGYLGVINQELGYCKDYEKDKLK